MSFSVTNVVYFFAERFKHAGGVRDKIKARLSPCYKLVCRLLWSCKGKLYLYHVELPVTQRCSLRCEKCSFMMPKFEHPVNYDVNDLLGYMDKLFDCVDVIQIFRLLGGEPFMYRDLDKIIDKALSSPKVKTVDIVTNGTILPGADLMEHMKDPRLTLQISDYGELSRKKNEIKAACDAAGVHCVLRDEKEKTWFDLGGLECRGRSGKELRKQMKHCGNICRSFLNGRLYFCPRASFGTKLGIPDPKSEYVDFTIDQPRDELRRQIYALNQRKVLSACNYCNEGTEDFVPVPVAEQVKENK